MTPKLLNDSNIDIKKQQPAENTASNTSRRNLKARPNVPVNLPSGSIVVKLAPVCRSQTLTIFVSVDNTCPEVWNFKS